MLIDGYPCDIDIEESQAIEKEFNKLLIEIEILMSGRTDLQ